jgi:hypothetical protein
MTPKRYSFECLCKSEAFAATNRFIAEGCDGCLADCEDPRALKLVVFSFPVVFWCLHPKMTIKRCFKKYRVSPLYVA